MTKPEPIISGKRRKTMKTRTKANSNCASAEARAPTPARERRSQNHLSPNSTFLTGNRNKHFINAKISPSWSFRNFPHLSSAYTSPTRVDQSFLKIVQKIPRSTFAYKRTRERAQVILAQRRDMSNDAQQTDILLLIENYLSNARWRRLRLADSNFWTPKGLVKILDKNIEVKFIALPVVGDFASVAFDLLNVVCGARGYRRDFAPGWGAGLVFR